MEFIEEYTTKIQSYNIKTEDICLCGSRGKFEGKLGMKGSYDKFS